ncbi:dihydrofolate reductase [Ancylobacter mangrovi]|uniref:Dihydrofolate reductase n=1 Tax=Ancylobacter mangrovi TaxID=2972472 RepID=A0A9X2PK46_9HYPH|nr:dihydrofolate reductase [Ancylobacter mangrovi]MCS0497550.1 dihydrofolate reductase [Ancylobacter mangrovi]MCS0503860.1 dihydrofolate reductase [Ancylobacter mangrovi]
MSGTENGTPPTLAIVAAIAANGVIGRGDQLPWHISGDLKRFRAITWGKPILMGRRTFDAIGRPLPGRTTIVITRDTGFVTPDGVMVAPTLGAALEKAEREAERIGADEIVVVGGAQIYAQALPLANRLRLTEVHGTPEGDIHFPDFDRAQWREVAREEPPQGEKDDFAVSYVDYERV